jgi:L-ascorbate metabolism protein UlaG (beta-lactamase superfamily)
MIQEFLQGLFGRNKLFYAVLLIWIMIPFLACASDPVDTDKPHHTKKGFQNSHTGEKPRFLSFLKWRWNRLWKQIPDAESFHFSLAESDPAFLRKNREDTTITWIGHATMLLQLKGKNILTDPHFSERASPVSWAGPKRVVPPGIPLDELPAIDMVVISHDHYDSLDRSTIMNLYKREGGRQTVFFVPLGFRKWFDSLGINKIVEMDWWDSVSEGGLTFIPVPIQHWSKRSPFSKNKTLWAGWVVQSNDFRFIFVGDSGYSPHFQEIGEKLGPFDLSAIPIGAYKPRWFMKNHHMNPEEAVKVHKDIGSRKSIAIHWGTFMLTDEPLDEPPQLLKKALKEHNIPDNSFVVLRHGGTIVIE